MAKHSSNCSTHFNCIVKLYRFSINGALSTGFEWFPWWTRGWWYKCCTRIYTIHCEYDTAWNPFLWLANITIHIFIELLWILCVRKLCIQSFFLFCFALFDHIDHEFQVHRFSMKGGYLQQPIACARKYFTVNSYLSPLIIFQLLYNAYNVEIDRQISNQSYEWTSHL